MGFEGGDDLTSSHRGAADSGVSVPPQPPASPVPTGLAGGPPPTAWGGPPPAAWGGPPPAAWGGPPPAAWGGTPATAYGWPGAAWAPARTRLPIIATLFAAGVGITFFLPWASFSFSIAPAYDLMPTSISVSLLTMLDGSDWPGHLWPDLVVFGFLATLVLTLLDATLRFDRRAGIVEALGFGAVVVGVILAMTSKYGDGLLSPLDAFDSGLLGSPASGAWLCLVLAAAGSVVAIIRSANPNAFTPQAAAPSAGPAGGQFAAIYQTPPYGPQYAAPIAQHYAPQFAPQYQPAWPPPPTAALYLAPAPSIPPAPTMPAAPSMPPASPVPPAPSMPAPADSAAAGAAGEAVVQATAEYLPGPPGTLVVVQAGQTSTRSVKPGELLIVGSDPDSGIVLADPRISPRHAAIERRGPGWLVRGLDIANPTWLLDATGRAHPIQDELGLRSGTLLIGGTQVRLYPPPS